jgi:flagellar biosynthetic protein FlhB
MLVIGGIDYMWQYQEHLRKNRMSHKEMMDEFKQNEGDPHMKQQRRQKGYEIAMNQMLADVPEADVVIVNPTHYAVALKWSRLPGEAPVCVAKGVDEIAARIREAAAEAGVPIHRNPPTARALHASVDIGHEILPDQYQAVAAAIRFAEMMRKKARNFEVNL